MKLKDIVKSEISINNLSEVLLPNAIDNYEVYKFIVKVKDEIKNYEHQLDKIIHKYGEQTEDGAYTVGVNSPNYTTCLQEISKLEEIEIDIKFKKIIVTPSAIKLRPVDWCNLKDIGLIEIEEVKNGTA